MRDERELERHYKILEQIENATNRNELPNITLSSIGSYLASNVHFGDEHLSPTEFAPIITSIVNNGGIVNNEEFRRLLLDIIKTNYPDEPDNKVASVIYKVTASPRIVYLLEEIEARNAKLDYLCKEENYKYHESNMKDIRNATDLMELPRVGMGIANQKIVRAFNDNDIKNDFKTADIKDVREAIIKRYSYSDLVTIIRNICSKYVSNKEDLDIMCSQITNNIVWDETIIYTIDEVIALEKRKLEIYKMDHEHTMEVIKNANRISQLPSNLTTSTLTSYLNGNTTIYSNDDRIKSEDLKKLASLLYDGYRWEDPVIIEEVKNITSKVYPDKDDAFDLLYNKLSSLPKTYYYVEEVNLALARQQEFIGRGSSNVNVYFLPNNNSPLDGGKFYTCYINRIDNLDLSSLLPLDLDSIVPEGIKKDTDSVEWYVQEKFDPTFKKAGGIILNKDEEIGNVNVFKPNDGKYGVTLEEKEKIDTISDLDKEIGDKKAELAETEEKATSVNNRMQEIITNYEKKALLLQKELLNSIKAMKEELGLADDDEAPKRGGFNG